MNNNPHLEMIVGPMFSGKTTELIRRLTRAKIAGKDTLLIRPKIDHTDLTHDRKNQLDHPTVRLNSIDHRKNFSHDVIGIDEVQFFPDSLESIMRLASGRVVIASGLDTTFAFEPFTIVPQLLSYAEKVDKLTAICVKCGNDATRTQRIVAGKPAKRNDPIVLVGDEDFYEARCSNCWEIG